MRKYSICDFIISAVTLAVVSAVLVPAVAVVQRSPEDARCQSNMTRWVEAIQLYVEDNDGTFPTNRVLPRGFMTAYIPLSPRGLDENGDPVRFVYGINWVEALYPYVIKSAKSTGRDWESFLKCPNAGDTSYPLNSPTAGMTYVFNYNLLEQPDGVIRNSAKLMLLRELDRLTGAVCRPYNQSYSSSYRPQSPFLTTYDFGIRNTTLNNKLHGNGSYIVFADGHVAFFGEEYFPSNVVLNEAESWDPETNQWWNWVNKDPAVNKAIAVTP